MSGLPVAKTAIRSFKAINRKSGSFSFSLLSSCVTVCEVGFAGRLVAILTRTEGRAPVQVDDEGKAAMAGANQPTRGSKDARMNIGSAPFTYVTLSEERKNGETVQVALRVCFKKG